MRTLLAVFLAAASAVAQDRSLAPLRTTLLKLRAPHEENLQTRGASADLTVAKHQRRDWIESQLAGVKPGSDLKAFEARLNGALKAARLICDETEQKECEDPDRLPDE